MSAIKVHKLHLTGDQIDKQLSLDLKTIDLIQNELIYDREYNKDSLTLGRYYNIKRPGETMSPDSQSSQTQLLNCIKFKVEKSKQITISTVGGTSNARGYGMTDNNFVVLFHSDESIDTRENPVVIIPEQDGWLFINCTDAGIDDFLVKIKTSKLDNVDSEINTLKTTVQQHTQTIESNSQSIDEYEIKIKNIETDIFENKEYNKDNLTLGRYYNIKRPGETMSPDSQSSQTQLLNCIKFKVEKSKQITISTVGGTSNARGYGMTDNNFVVLFHSDESIDTRENPSIIIPEQDGWLFVNCTDAGIDDFNLIIQTSKIPAIETAVSQNAQSIQNINISVEKINAVEAEVFKIEEYDKDSLILGKYYNIKSVGDIISDTPGTSSSGANCGKFKIEKGRKIIISVLGGASNVRGWGLTDNDLRILSRSDINVDTRENSAVIIPDQDGWLFVNCMNAGINDFFVKKDVSNFDILQNKIDSIETKPIVPRYHNNPLPIGKSTFKVLAIGNSFIGDAIPYIADMVTAANIPASSLCIYSVVKGGSNLNNILDIYNNGQTLSENNMTCARLVGSINMNISASNTLAEILSNDWDVVIYNQYTQHSDYKQLNPALTEMIFHTREHCTNQAVALAWHAGWTRQHEKGGYPNGTDAYWDVMQTVNKMQIINDGIDIIIPSGTAIQNARHTSLSGEGEMTRDGVHMVFGAGKYIVSATWFQTLIAPMFGCSILGNTCLHEQLYQTEADADATLQALYEEDPINNMYFPPIYVTAENYKLCQLCAFWATIDKWNIHEITVN